MDYSQLSNLEINQRVSNTIPGRFIFYPDYVWDSEWEKTFDPCNKAADAWPIITDNKISIYAMSEADARGKWGAEAFYPNEAYHFNDNPLRASMIVFLMMQDAKHA